MAKTVKNCPICGCELAWGLKGKGCGPQPGSPSLDRIDNGQAITKETIQIICHQCNATKRSRTMDEFVEYSGVIWNKFKIIDQNEINKRMKL